jgi:hypothetical protein
VTALTDALAPTVGVPWVSGSSPPGTARKPWVVIWPDAGVRSAVTMKANDGYAETWVCHCFGLTPDSAAVAARLLTAAIYNLHQDIVRAGWCSSPEQTSAVPLQRDDDADPPLWNYVMEWRLRTSPA